jgi:hypothetical protein
MFGVNSSILIPFIRTSIFLILAGTTRVDWSSIQYLYFTAEIWLWVVLYTDDVHTTMAKEFHISILTFRYQVRLRWRQFAQDFKFMYGTGLSNESSACSSILGHHRITSTPVPFIVVDIFICIYINNIYNNSFRNKCL